MSARRLTLIFCLAEICSMTGFATFAALLPGFVAEWSLSGTQAGWINGIFFAGYVAAVPFLVSLTDRRDPRHVYLAAAAITLVSSLGFALFAEGFWPALIFRALAGVGLAGTYMPGLKSLTDHLPTTVRGRSLAFYTATFSIGTSLSFLLAGALAARWGWAWAFGLAALGPAIAFLLIWRGRWPAPGGSRGRGARPAAGAPRPPAARRARSTGRPPPVPGPRARRPRASPSARPGRRQAGRTGWCRSRRSRCRRPGYVRARPAAGGRPRGDR